MTDEELKALADRLDQMGRIDGVLTMSLSTVIAVEDTQAAASAIRQLMRERDAARTDGNGLRLYKIWQDENNDYDTYDSAVVVAADEDAARGTHPYNYGTMDPLKFGDLWAPIEKIKVQFLGPAAPGIEAGVIVASFNAG